MLQIEGYTTIRSGNIYTAVVRAHPLESTMLIGLFAVNEGVPHTVNRDGKCYIALALSCDGTHWSRLTPYILSGFHDESPEVRRICWISALLLRPLLLLMFLLC